MYSNMKLEKRKSWNPINLQVSIWTIIYDFIHAIVENHKQVSQIPFEKLYHPSQHHYTNFFFLK